MRGRGDRDRENLASLAWTAWHAAGFVKARKRLPNLATLIRNITRRTRREQSPKEGVKIAETLNRLFGGKDRRKRRG